MGRMAERYLELQEQNEPDGFDLIYQDFLKSYKDEWYRQTGEDVSSFGTFSFFDHWTYEDFEKGIENIEKVVKEDVDIWMV